MSGRPREFEDEAVVQAAMDVFWTHGYEASSAHALCERTGLGRGSLYNAFGSKQKLYEQALIRYQELGIAAQTRILNGPGPVKARLRALLQWGIDGDLSSGERRSCMALFAAMDRSGKDPAIDKINRGYVKRLEAALRELFAAGQRGGEVAADRNADELARAFLASYYGLRVLGHSMPERAFLQDVLEGTLARF